MKCQEVRRLLQLYSDGELDLVRQLELVEHFAGCAECTAQEKNLRSLRAAISSESLYYREPASLRTRVKSAMPPVTRGRRRSSLQLAAIAAGVLLIIVVPATAWRLWPRMATRDDDRLAEQVVASHVRSLQVDHLMDVESADGHIVKPWFRGKLDFSPQVIDLAPHGYPLSGGRLDYLADRQVAALVYHRRLHAINVFTWPAVNGEEIAVQRQARQGYNIRHWQRSGMTWWAISDLNDQEFDEFVRLFQEHLSAIGPNASGGS
jgi:anti-sigma factor RsiW